MLATWAIVRLLFASHQVVLGPHEELLLVRLENIFGASVLLALKVPEGTLDALEAIANAINNNLGYLVTICTLAAVSYVALQMQPQMTEAYLAFRQCDVVPWTELLLLPLANIARLGYAAAWPLVNIGAEMYHWATVDTYKIAFACTPLADLGLVTSELAAALRDLADALGTWLSTGFTTERLDVTSALTHVGLAANAALIPLECYCSFLQPVWEWLVAIPQSATVQTSVDCAVNVPIRFGQMLWGMVSFTLQAPDAEELTIEWNCAWLALGDTAQELALTALNTLLGILDELLALSMTSEQWHAAAQGKSMNATIGGPIWMNPDDPMTLNNTLGLAQLVALLTTQWTHPVTELIAGASTLVNMTLAATVNATMPDTCTGLIDSPDGIRFVQVYLVFDRVRAAVDAATGVLTIFSSSLPCVASGILQAWVTLIETVVELIIVLVYGIAFPMWLPGVPIDPGCIDHDSCWNCTTFDAGTSFWDVLPAYNAWPQSSLQRALDLLVLDADCVAESLGALHTTISGFTFLRLTQRHHPPTRLYIYICIYTLLH